MENIAAFTQSTGKIVFFLLVLMAVFLLTVKSKNKLSNRLFGIELLVISFDITGFFIDSYPDYPLLNSLKMASSLLQLPLFYGYVVSVCDANFRLKWHHLLHSALFVVFFAALYLTKFDAWTVSLYEIIGELQFVGYMIGVFIVLRKYRTLYHENYSAASESIYKWLFQISVLSCVAHTFVLGRLFISNTAFASYVPIINLLISLMVLSVITFFVLKALYQPDLFKGINMSLMPSKSLFESKEPTDDNENSSYLNKELERLITFMEHEKPYLDDGLTLQKLGTQFDKPERELSVLINQHTGKHFFDFINHYRIQEAQHLLATTKLTVQEILYQVGFNSKSSFYTAFKKMTDQTPSAYRKLHAIK